MIYETEKGERVAGINIRVPLALRETIKVPAARNRRTMNGEILFILERTFRPEGAEDAPT